MTKVLFLDIDGVLNSMDNMYAMTALWKKDKEEKPRDDFSHLFDERCVRWLDYIIRRTECKIVISSTWRRSGVERMKQMWEMRGLPGEVIDITPSYADKKIIEQHLCEGADRGYEIQQWIEEHRPDRYCIVDDDSDMLPHQPFVNTKGRIGLNYETAHEIINILNDETVEF